MRVLGPIPLQGVIFQAPPSHLESGSAYASNHFRSHHDSYELRIPNLEEVFYLNGFFAHVRNAEGTPQMMLAFLMPEWSLNVTLTI